MNRSIIGWKAFRLQTGVSEARTTIPCSFSLFPSTIEDRPLMIVPEPEPVPVPPPGKESR